MLVTSRSRTSSMHTVRWVSIINNMEATCSTDRTSRHWRCCSDCTGPSYNVQTTKESTNQSYYLSKRKLDTLYYFTSTREEIIIFEIDNQQETQLIADKARDAFRGQSLSPNMHGTIPYVRYCFLLLCYSEFFPVSDIRLHRAIASRGKNCSLCDLSVYELSAGTRRFEKVLQVCPIRCCLINLTDDWGCGDNCSYKTCKATVKSSSSNAVAQSACSIADLVPFPPVSPPICRSLAFCLDERNRLTFFDHLISASLKILKILSHRR